MPYPVTFDVEQPGRFDRGQVVLRLLILIILAILGGALGWIYGLVYLAIPVLAAILISQRGSERYIADAPDNMVRWLRVITGFYAYISLLTDSFPDDAPGGPVRFDVQAHGTPSLGDALLRIILAIPHAVVLWFLGIVAAILAIIAAVMILVQESYPASIYGFLRGYVRWQARVLAYMAALTQDYPPFELDTSGGGGAAEPQAPPGAT
jgi:hypothetical protein